MNQYQKLKNRHQREFEAFPKFYAFSEKQFLEGMRKLKLKENETDKIVSISGGGYIKKSDIEKFKKMNEKHKQEINVAIAKDVTGKHFIKDMFKYELANHEYGFTENLEDTLNALQLSMDEINNNKALKKGLLLARKEYLKVECAEEEFGE